MLAVEGSSALRGCQDGLVTPRCLVARCSSPTPLIVPVLEVAGLVARCTARGWVFLQAQGLCWRQFISLSVLGLEHEQVYRFKDRPLHLSSLNGFPHALESSVELSIRQPY